MKIHKWGGSDNCYDHSKIWWESNVWDDEMNKCSEHEKEKEGKKLKFYEQVGAINKLYIKHIFKFLFTIER